MVLLYIWSRLNSQEKILGVLSLRPIDHTPTTDSTYESPVKLSPPTKLVGEMPSKIPGIKKIGKQNSTTNFLEKRSQKLHLNKSCSITQDESSNNWLYYPGTKNDPTARQQNFLTRKESSTHKSFIPS